MGVFWDVRDYINDETAIYMAVGIRNIGKTYSPVRYMRDQILAGHEVLYVRRRAAGELEQGKRNLFAGVEDIEVECVGNVFYKIEHVQATKRDGTIKDEIIKIPCGYAMALSSTKGIRGINCEAVNTVFFDEFTVTNAAGRYLKDEFVIFGEFMETVMRLRNDVKIIMSGNAFNFYNPYTVGWNIKLGKKQTKWLSRDHLISYQLVQGMEMQKQRAESISGKLFRGTEYDKAAGQNIFIINNDANVCRKPADAYPVLSVICQGKEFSIWTSRQGVYVSNSSRNTTVQTYTVDRNKVSSGTTLLGRKTYAYLYIRNAYLKGALYYESEAIKDGFDNVIRLMAIY